MSEEPPEELPTRALLARVDVLDADDSMLVVRLVVRVRALLSVERKYISNIASVAHGTSVWVH